MSDKVKKKHILSILSLSIIVFSLAGILISHALTRVTIIPHERLSTGAYFIWDDGFGNWQNGIGPGSEVTRTFSINIGKDRTNIKVKEYNGSNFSFSDEPTCHWNRTIYCQDSTSYEEYYVPKSADSKSATFDYNSNTGSLTITETLKLVAQEPFDIATLMRNNQQQTIYDYMGGDLPQNMQDFINQTEIAESVQGILYFCPLVITYDEVITEEIEESLDVSLDIPEEATINQDYTVKNNSVYSEGAQVASSVLTKTVNGVTTTLPNWHAGTQSIIENSATTGEITYTLTETLTNGESDSDTKTIEITNDEQISGDADIIAEDQYTYIGHPTTFKDKSNITVTINGETQVYSAASAYELGYASNRFALLNNTTNYSTERISSTRQQYIFNTPGAYTVQLRVTADGQSYYDTDSVEVRNTPDVSASIGGTQKQNRKQTLSFSIAKHPSYPITDIYAIIRNTSTGEEVKVTPSSNPITTNIKTRAMQITHDEYFDNCTIDFLTKYNTVQNFSYEVYAKDSKGDTDTCTGTFTVNPDIAPQAAIDMQAEFTRNENSNIATITASDATPSADGDQVTREWYISFDTNANGVADTPYYPISNYNLTDLSFGTLKDIQFNKTGVGVFNLKLNVKEYWTEPTLSEFISDSDYLTGTANKNADVINVPPVVSIDPIKTYPADMLLITTQKDYQNVINKSAELKAKFKNYGIDNVTNIKAIDTPNPNDITEISPVQDLIGLTPGGSISFAGSKYEVDNKYTYYIKTSGITRTNNKDYLVLPYKLVALNNDTGQQAWAYTLPDDASFSINKDQIGKYIYVSYESGSKTILLDRNTGAYIGQIAFNSIDSNIYANSKYIYFYKPTGIFRYSITKGTTETLLAYTFNGSSASNIVEGKIHSVYYDNTKKIVYRVILDLETDTYQKQYICKYGDLLLSDDCNVLSVEDIDISGKILFKRSWENDWDNWHSRIVTYGLNNKILGDITTDWTDHKPYIRFIANETNKATHVICAWYSCTSNYDYYNIQVFNLNGTKLIDYEQRYGEDRGPRGLTMAKYISKYNYIHAVTEMDIEVDNLSVSGNAYTFDALTGQKITTKNISDDIEFFESSDLHYTCGWFEEGSNLKDEDGTYNNNRFIHIGKYTQSLENSIERTVLKEEWHREESQKYLTIMDDVYITDTANMSNIINIIKQKGLSFLFVGDNLTSNPNSYGNKIKNAVSGQSIEYDNTGISANIAAITSKIDYLKADIINSVKVLGTAAGNAKMYFDTALDYLTKYEYEYEIRYNKENTSNTADLMSLTHNITTNSNNSASSSSAKVTSYHKENFDDDDFDSYFNLGTLNISKIATKFNEYDLDPDGRCVYVYSNSSETISFTTTNKSTMTFKYSTGIDRYSTRCNFKIEIDGESVVYLTKSQGWTSYKQYLLPGTHSITISTYRYKTATAATGGIDDIEINELEFGTNIEDSGSWSKLSDNVTVNNWKHVLNTFISPPPIVKYTKVGTVQYMYDEYSDNAVSSLLSVTGAYAVGTAPSGDKCIYTYPVSKGEDKTFTVNLNLPAGYYADIEFTYQLKGTLARIAEATVYINNSEVDYICVDDDYGSLDERSYSQKAVPNGSSIEFAVENLTNSIAYFELKNIKILYYPAIALDNTSYFERYQNGGIYAPSKTYSGASSIGLSFSSSAPYDFNIRNFKLYKYAGSSRELILNRPFVSQQEFDDVWTKSNTNSSFAVQPAETVREEEDVPLVYKKGQLVQFNINYSDYEGDPSKISYWKYAHTPWNDGLHPDSGKTLTEPIERFYVDGKYVLQHWQYDSTGTSSYDKSSNVETIVFYVSGEVSNDYIPYVKTIAAEPSKVTEGSSFKIKTTVGDNDNDTLEVTIDVYQKTKCIYSYTKSNLTQTNGVYPAVTSGTVSSSAQAGTYTAVVTVSDHDGVGVKYYKFTVESEGSITGAVSHTPEWNQNRINYNMKHSGTQDSPRAYNVFWSGERFVLHADTEGKPEKVSVQINNTSYSTWLTSSDAANWSGSLWDKSMIGKWGRISPETLTFTFTAYFGSGKTLIYTVPVIVDDRDPYWKLHRLF